MSLEIDKLNEEERAVILRAPAIVAILAAVSDDGIVSEDEKAEAVKLSQLRTYTSPEILHNYYKEVEKVFEDNFNLVMSNLPESWEEKEAYLKSRIDTVNDIIKKLDQVYAKELINSLRSFSKHVFKSNSTFLENFVLPIFMTKMDKEGFDPMVGK